MPPKSSLPQWIPPQLEQLVEKAPSRIRYKIPVQNERPCLDRHNLGAGAIIELGRARALVRRHRLRVFESAAGFEISRDPTWKDAEAGHKIMVATVFGKSKERQVRLRSASPVQQTDGTCALVFDAKTWAVFERQGQERAAHDQRRRYRMPRARRDG
jgi:hypothetical protein